MATTDTPAPGATALTAPRRNLRILMVDDHEDTSRAMSRLLGRLGYQVRTAGTVRAALDVAAHHPFDLLISDIGLPDGTGIELIQKLLETMPVKGIALSGFGMEDDIRRSREAGFVEHLTKPINLEHLEDAIQRLTMSESG